MPLDLNGSPLSLAILGLLSFQTQSGYDLRKCFASTPMGHFSSSPGAVYPALVRLEKLGWIHGSQDSRQALRPRNVFSLTAQGRGQLLAHLACPVTRDQGVWRLDELLLRFSLMGHLLDGAIVAAFLMAFEAETLSYVAELLAQQAVFPRGASATARWALSYGIEQYQASAAWARQALKDQAFQP